MRFLFLPLLALLAPPLRADYQVVARFPVGGDASSYDYVRVDAEARRVYLAHEKRFEVLDADSGRKLGEIGPVQRAHGVALAPASGHGFASSGIDDLIIMFDLKTLAKLREFKSSGSNPDSIEFDPESGKVYVANHGDTGDVTVIDPVSGDIVATVKLQGGKLEGLGFDGRGQGFVNDEDKSAVHVFDTHTFKAKAVWSVAPGDGGTGLAVDAAGHRLFSACGNNKLVVLDSDTGKVVATPAIGEDPDGAAFDPQGKIIATSNYDGTMSLLHQDSPDKYSVRQTLPTMAGAKTIGFDAKTGRFVTSAAKLGPKPAQVKGGPKPRAPILAGTFEVLVIGQK